MQTITWQQSLRGCIAHCDYADAVREYNSMNIFRRFLTALLRRAPRAPEKGLHAFMTDFTTLLCRDRGIGLREELGDGRTFHVGVGFGSGPLPVLKATYFDGAAAYQTRLAFLRDGSTRELGIEYPYSEIGVTGRCDDPALSSRYLTFDSLCREISQFITDIRPENI